MILCDKSIISRLEMGLVDLDKSENVTWGGLLSQVNPNTLDLTIGSEFQWEHSGTRVIRYGMKNAWEIFFSKNSDEKHVLHPGNCLLAHTREYIHMPNDICGFVFTKSSLGRTFVNHMMAGVIDAGFEGQITLELKNEGRFPVWIEPSRRIVQLVLVKLDGIPSQNYGELITSRYQGQTGVTFAREEKDYD